MSSNLTYLMFAAPIAVLCLAMLTRHLLKMHVPDSWRRRFVMMRESGRLFILMALIIPCFYLFMITVFLRPFGGSMVIRLLGALPMACMFAGMQLLGMARRPAGDQLRCSKCKYDLTGLSASEPSGPNGKHDARCPECGWHWGWPGGSERTKKVWSKKWCAAAILLCLPVIAYFTSVPIGGIFWWNRALLTLAPTHSLVKEVLTQRGSTMDSWAELARRTPSAEDKARIAEKILTPPIPTTYFSTDEVTWLTRELAAHTIDPRLIEPRLQRMFTVAARPGNSSEIVLLTLKPVPAEFGPFQKLELSVFITGRAEGEPDQRAAFVIAGQGIAVFKSYPIKSIQGTQDASEGRFRGTLTVILQLPGSPPLGVNTTSRPAPISGGLYRVDIPLDIPVESAK